MFFITLARIAAWVGLVLALGLLASLDEVLSRSPSLADDVSYMTQKVIKPILSLVATSILLGAVGEIGKMVSDFKKREPKDV
ncbi:hypothetical protein [Ruegeria sp. HKCCA5491]|uniref:hypothetical protein n=1 Tax=Ruegeria sp. HKCCA5491 TaxID=2682986 RepID=UPI0014809794|nr:hypothetical protein [Ruegeria sp. HKCCA5491]